MTIQGIGTKNKVRIPLEFDQLKLHLLNFNVSPRADLPLLTFSQYRKIVIIANRWHGLLFATVIADCFTVEGGGAVGEFYRFKVKSWDDLLNSLYNRCSGKEEVMSDTDKKYVLCINAHLAGDFIYLGSVYQVERETPRGQGILYTLVGVLGTHNSDRFKVLENPTTIKCIDDAGVAYILKNGDTYTGYPVNVVEGAFYIIPTFVVPNKSIKWQAKRFEVVGQSPIATKSAATTTSQDSDKLQELAFFKTRRHSNECPCGSTRGICPDHP